MGKQAVKETGIPGFPLRESKICRSYGGMRRTFHFLLHRLPVPNGYRLDRELRNNGVKRAKFVSYLEASGYRTNHVDSFERSVRRRKLAKAALFWITAFFAAWIVIESAKALTIS
jgi:hypothetical protein